MYHVLQVEPSHIVSLPKVILLLALEAEFYDCLFACYWI